MKREAELKSLFRKQLMRDLPHFLMLQYLTNGAPDRSIIGLGVQSNWEAKHATPDFKSPGDQELVCAQMAAAGHARYIIWFERGTVQKTMIVHPRVVLRQGPHAEQHDATNLTAEAWCVGFDMRWLVEQVRKVHAR